MRLFGGARHHGHTEALVADIIVDVTQLKLQGAIALLAKHVAVRRLELVHAAVHAVADHWGYSG